MDFEAIIGLEIHVEMKTKSKMFSASPCGFSRRPNTQVTPFDLGHPGTLPRVNKMAVLHAIRVAHALHMDIDRLLRFDRKNYFYSDLPKGFQITQHFHPIGKNGYVEIADKEGNPKRIGVEEIHLEEDSAKQLHFKDYTLLDYNRAGVPLVEIVSRPEIRNGAEASRYVEAIRRIVIYTLTSDGKMEEGSLRCDVNVSLRKGNETKFGTKVEIKNVNSIKNVEAAIDYEILRQKRLLEKGEEVPPETRRYDETGKGTVVMRVKEADADYKYFAEPNIPPVRLSEDFIREAIETCPELYEEKKKRYLALGLTSSETEILLSDIDVSCYFDRAIQSNPPAKVLANLLIVEVQRYLNKNGIGITVFPLTPTTLADLAKKREEGYSHNQVVELLSYCLAHPESSLEDATASTGMAKQSDDREAIRSFVRSVLDANPRSIADYKAGKDRAFGYLVGQVLKQSKGKIKPSLAAEVMAEELKGR